MITGVDYFKTRNHWDQVSKKIVFTGKIDEYFDYCHGELEYRTLNFTHVFSPVENVQGVPVINYTSDEVSWTRSIEHKHFENVKTPHTVVTYETPEAWAKGKEPYYPVNDSHNNSLVDEYNKDVSMLTNVIFGGRLAKYKYYDMDQVIASALVSAEKFLNNRSKKRK